MEEFKLGDKVRPKNNRNLIGIISEISFNNKLGEVNQIVTVTVDYQTEIQIDACDIEKIDEEKEIKEMASYRVGDIIVHPLYNESIVIDDNSTSRFESGHIEIVPLTGLSRGLPTLVSIDKVKYDKNKLIISIEDYNEMANTIENLKEENIKLKERTITMAHENWNFINEIKNLKEENYTLKDEIVNSKLRKDINANALYYFGYNLPEIKSVLYHKPATIIFWKDGTKTVVKAHKKEKYDNEKGFVMAYLKKILGNEGNYYEVIKRWTDIQ